ncbi:MAG: YggS family pyridoxal phosphate-dependent enzyme, partial [Candidatus Zixiibacteriota bacterium]
MKDTIIRNLTEIRGRIAEACEEYDRDADEISLLAVTKGFPAAYIKTIVAAGVYEIGESRVQEAEAKILEVGRIARFHMIGHLQTNKARRAVQLFDVIQSVDSFKLAAEINSRASQADRVMECFVEVNTSGEPQKYGVSPDETLPLLERLLPMPHLKVTGLMTIGPLTNDEEAVRAAFRRCRELFEAGKRLVGDDFEHLSMGMTHDFPLAIAEGSTMVRIGTGLFG